MQITIDLTDKPLNEFSAELRRGLHVLARDELRRKFGPAPVLMTYPAIPKDYTAACVYAMGGAVGED